MTTFPPVSAPEADNDRNGEPFSADLDIEAGRVSGPYEGPEAFMAALDAAADRSDGW